MVRRSDDAGAGTADAGRRAGGAGRAGGLRATVRTYLPNLIYGANDGIVTTFAIVSGVVGAKLPAHIVLILGLASLAADALSMAASNYLSERSRPGDRMTRRNAAKHGAATFVGFLVAGAVPLLGYLVPLDESYRFAVAGALTLATLFAVGAGRAFAAEHINWLRGGLEMFLVGAIAAGTAYGIGAMVSQVTAGESGTPLH